MARDLAPLSRIVRGGIAPPSWVGLSFFWGSNPAHPDVLLCSCGYTQGDRECGIPHYERDGGRDCSQKPFALRRAASDLEGSRYWYDGDNP